MLKSRFSFNILPLPQVILNVYFKRILSKRGVKLLSTNDESKLLVADKSGDVYIIDLNNLQNTDFTLLMGHISSLLDVVSMILF